MGINKLFHSTLAAFTIVNEYMRKIIPTALCLLWITFNSFSQSDQQNLLKYWNFRDAFLEDFIKVGRFEGESLPAMAIGIGNCVDNDAVFDGTPINGTYYSDMHWGDGTLNQGHYLGFLATEYFLRKENSMDTNGVLNELYYALNALNRLDLGAEPYLDEEYGLTLNPTLNGFYLRDDVPDNFRQNWIQKDWQVGCLNSDQYYNNNVLQEHNGQNFIVKNINYLNAPSLDQMTSLLVGLRVIKELVPNIYVKPTTNDSGFFLITEVRQIATRMLSYARDRDWQLIDINGWPVANGGGEVILTAYPMIIAWSKIMDITEVQALSLMGFYNAVRRRLETLSIANLQSCITGYGSSKKWSQLEQDSICNRLSNPLNPLNAIHQLALSQLSGSGDPGVNNNQNNSVYLNWQSSGLYSIDLSNTIDLWSNDFNSDLSNILLTFSNDSLVSTLSFPLNQFKLNKDKAKAHNLTILFNSGVISGLWDKNTVNDFGDFTGDRELELINSLLRNEQPQKSRQFYKSFLDSMPQEGPYSIHGRGWNVQQNAPYSYEEHVFTENGWAASYRWTKPQFKYGQGENNPYRGRFNALDYMYFHNLYRILFRDEISNKFKRSFECDCSSQLQIPVGGSTEEVLAKQIVNQKLQFIPTCKEDIFEGNHDVSGLFEITTWFPEYADYDIRVNKYILDDVRVFPSAEVKMYTNTVLCNTHSLQIDDNAVFDVINGTFKVNIQSSVDIYGDLIIREKGVVDFGAASSVTIHSGGRIIIEDGGQLLINYGGVLRYHDGAKIITSGENSEIVLRGAIGLMDDGTTFEIDHVSSPQSGRFIVEGTSAWISKSNVVTGFCDVVLNGKDENDEFLIIKENSRLKFEDGVSPFAVGRVRIHSCKVELGENSFIEVRQPFRTNNCSYTSVFDNAGLTITDDNHILNCTFSDVPIYADLLEGYNLRLSHSTLMSDKHINEVNHDNLLTVTGGFYPVGMEIYNSHFSGSSIACIRSEALGVPSKIKNCFFEHSDPLTSFSATRGLMDYSNSDIQLEGNNFNQIGFGVHGTFNNYLLKCNDFNNIDFSIAYLSFGSKIEMSTDDLMGYNNFGKTEYWSQFEIRDSDFKINNGRNYFSGDQNNLYINGNTLTPCPSNLVCSWSAKRNQWGPTLALPQQNKFSISDPNGNPFDITASPTELQPECGYYENTNGTTPFTSVSGPGQSLVGLNQNNGNSNPNTNNGVANSTLPFVTTFFNPSIRLDNAVKHGIKKMKIHDSLGNDVYAVEVFNDVFNNNLSKHNPHVKKWLDLSLSSMKSAIENAVYEDNISPQNNQALFDNYVQMYVDALNYMSDSLITRKNYKEQFYLELDKAQLFYLLEMPEVGSEILSEVDYCGLDSSEQIALNYWKKQFKTYELKGQFGVAYRDTNIVVDTTSYNLAYPYNPPKFYFGSKINSVHDIVYRDCNDDGYRSFETGNSDVKNKFSVYPNPAQHEVNLTCENHEFSDDLTVQLLSTSGKIVRTYSIREFRASVKLNLDGISPGTYLIEVITNSDNNKEIGTLVVQ